METTGFSVKIREKKHLHVLEMLAAVATTTSPSKLPADIKLRQAGNCTPHALASLGFASLEKVAAKLSQDSLPENVYMKETYKQSSVLRECECRNMATTPLKWEQSALRAVERLDAAFQMTDDAFLDALRGGADT